MRMTDAYRAMLAKASGKDLALQALKLVRAKLLELKRSRGRGEFSADDVDDVAEVLDRGAGK